MNSRERVTRAIEFGSPDRLPLWPRVEGTAWIRHGRAPHDLLAKYPFDLGGLPRSVPRFDDQPMEWTDDRLSKGALVAALELPEGANPWLDGAGMFQDDPLFDDWQRAIADRRREVDESADTP